MPNILHTYTQDLDCFYAQVEQRRLGIAASTPLAVQQWDGLIAVNYAARPYGIKRGMRIAEAKSLCKDLVLVHVELIGGTCWCCVLQVSSAGVVVKRVTGIGVACCRCSRQACDRHWPLACQASSSPVAGRRGVPCLPTSLTRHDVRILLCPTWHHSTCRCFDSSLLHLYHLVPSCQTKPVAWHIRIRTPKYR